MTENTAVLKHGFTLWQNGYGWFGSNGKLTCGPRSSKVKLLADIETAVEKQARFDELLPVGDEPELGPAPINPVRPRPVVDEPVLCVHCHQIKPHDTVFDGRGRCPDCR